MTLSANLAALARRTVGLLAGNLLVLEEDEKLPALDGSLLTGLPILGVDQTVSNVTASRSKNTIYQNTSDKPLVVTISITSANGSTGYFYLYAGATTSLGITLGYYGSSSTSTESHVMTVIIPPGYYYELYGSGPSVVQWSEYADV